MSTPSQAPKSPAFSPESVRNVRAAVVSTEGGVASIHRNVSVGVDSAMVSKPQESVTRIGADDMRALVQKKVQNLPPLPKTIVELYEMRRSDDPDLRRLLEIINGDPMMAANLLKLSNSVSYGRSQNFKTPSEALAKIGYRMAINIAISTSMSAHVKPDLTPYGSDIDTFTKTTKHQNLIIETWSEPKISAIRSELGFAAFLQEV